MARLDIVRSLGRALGITARSRLPTPVASTSPSSAQNTRVEADILHSAEALWNRTDAESHAESAVQFHLALELFRSPAASYRLGCAYMLGKGVPRSPCLAAAVLRTACDAGVQYAFYYRGKALADADNPDRDAVAARALLEKAVSMGIPHAVAFLAANPGIATAGDPSSPLRLALGSTTRLEGLIVPPRPPGTCPICGTDQSNLPDGRDLCGRCNTRPRTRTLPLICAALDELIEARGPREQRSVLGFAMAGAEVEVVDKYFGNVTSASLYGTYASNHLSGIDIRRMPRFTSETFDAVFGILLFDYFTEHDEALAEVSRCLRPGGVFFTHIGAYRLRDDGSAPIDTGPIVKRKGYFEYVPDDAAMPSVRVGRTWFVEAMARAGLVPAHLRVDDPLTGETFDWFVGVKPLPDGTVPTALRAEGAKNDTLPLPGGRRRARPLGRSIGASGTKSGDVVAYSARLPEGFSIRELRLRLSSPRLPERLRGSYFAEHVVDPHTGSATDTVVVTGRGQIGVSNNLGVHWRRVPVPGAGDALMWNCFTTASGRRLIQTAGWRDQLVSEGPADHCGRIHLFDSDWRHLGEAVAGTADWHGTASIGQSGGTIMFAEYYDNALRYRPDFEARRVELEPRLRANAIWRSRDDGETWQKVFERGPFEIRHLHTLQPDPTAPGTWWASSGDRWSESRVWCSVDDGDTWKDVTNAAPDIAIPHVQPGELAACHRYTDIVVGTDDLLWGSDDMLGRHDQYDLNRPLPQRAGARLFRSPKSDPLRPREIAYVGQTIRKLMDIGPGWLVLGEAKYPAIGLDVQVSYLDKATDRVALLCELGTHDGNGTGLSYSRGSKRFVGGTGFSMKRRQDVVVSDASLLKWEVDID